MSLFNLEERNVKTVRVLVYPNITFQKDLEKDSYVQVIKKQISLLNEIRDDLWFYLILTEPISSLQFENVTNLYIDLPTYPPTMRSHFDVIKLQRMFKDNLDFDLVMTHLPEHTHQLKNTLYNVTHHVPPFFGYCHWFDVKEVVAWSKDSFLQNITGLLEYDRCYLNTEYQKQLVLNQARETFNEPSVSKLNDILVVQHLGVDEKDVVEDINTESDKIIVFNHRPDTYKHFQQFIALTDRLWEMRQDFKVWVPLLDKPNRDYVVTDRGDKAWYYKELEKCHVGFSPKQKYGGWSVSTTDGMMNGVPYIMYNAGYYHELYKEGDFFDDDHNALMLLNTYLDDRDYRNEQATKALDWIRNHLVYKDKMIEMNNYMNDLLSKQKVMGNSDKMNEIIQFIRERESVSKKELMSFLNWGRGIKFSPYRRALMNHPNIYDVDGEEPRYFWKSVI